MNEPIALPPQRPTRLNTVVVFIISGIALAIAAFGYYERQQLLGIARETVQVSLPKLMNSQRTIENLKLLRQYGDIVAYDSHPEERRRAFVAAQLLAGHSSLSAEPQVAPAVGDAAALLAQLAVADSGRDAMIQRWTKMSGDLRATANDMATAASEPLLRQSERVENVVEYARFGAVAIVGAMALLAAATLYLRRRQRTTEASLDHAESLRLRLEGENALLRLMADNAAGTMIFAHSPEAGDDFVLTYANAAFARHLGYARHEVASLSARSFSGLSAHELGARMASLEQAKTLNFESEHCLRDGRRVPVEVTLNWIEHHGRPLVAGYCRDIAERRTVEAHLRTLEVEAALRQHERRYKEFFDAFSDGIFMLDVAAAGPTTIAALNPAAERALGVGSAEALGKRATDMFPAEVAALLAEQDRRCVESGAPVRFEARIDSPAGLRIDDVTLVPLRDAEGRIHRLAGIARDITERVRMESQLRDAAAAMRTFLDNIPDPAWIKDRDNRYLAVNQAFIRHSRAEVPGDIVGKLDHDFFPPKVARANLAHDMQVVGSGRQFRHEESGEDREGCAYWLETVRSPMCDGDGNIVGSVGISHDITHRVHMQALLEARERAFRSLAGSLPDNIARYTPGAYFTYMNPALEHALDMPLAAALGKTPNECFPDGRYADYQRRILAVAQSGADGEMEMHISMPDGTMQLHHIRIVAERDEKGGVAGVLALGMDITARRRMEDALRDAHNFLYNIIDNVADPIFVKDREHRWIHLNRAACRLFGDTRDALIGKSDFDFFPEHQARSYWAGDEAVFESGREFTSEEDITNQKGETHCIFTRKTLFVDGNGAPILVGIISDVTERRRMEEALSASEEWHRTVFESVNDGIFLHRIVEGDGEALFPLHDLNQKGCELWGHSRADILAGNFDLLVMNNPPYDFAEATRRNRLAAAGEPQLFDWQLKRGDGSKIWGEVNLRRVRIGGEDFLLATIRDITARKQAEALLAQREREFRSLAETLPDNIVRYDREGVTVYVNPALERTLGDVAAAMIGTLPREFHPDGSYEDYAQLLDAVLAGGEAGELEKTLPGPHGETSVHQVRMVPERGENGEVVGVLAIGRDITERKRIEDALRFVAQRGWMGGAEDFLAALARHLGETLGVDYVVIDRLADEPGVAETAALYAKGDIAPNMRYALKDTPCDNVMGKSLCCYRQGIQALFPADTLLVDMGAESYVGIPLWDSTGQAIGLIAVIDGKPLRDEAAVSRLLQLVATRAAAELERERADNVLRQREREFRSLAENSPEHVARYTPDARVRYVNPGLEAVLGVPMAALVGHTPAENFPDGRFDEITARILAAGRDGVGSELEVAVPTADGDVRHHSILVAPERDERGAVVGVLTVGRDVTEYKQAHRRLFLLEFAMDHLRDGAFLVNRAGGIVNVNRASCEMLGYERAELVRRPLFDIAPDLAPETWDAHWQDIVRMGGKSQIETRNRAKHGGDIPVEVAISIFDFDGEAYNLALVRDISERKRMEDTLRSREEEFRALADNSPDPIFRYDREGCRIYVNKAVLALARLPYEALVGWPPTDRQIVSRDEAERLMGSIRRVVETGGPAESEVEFVSPEGRRYVFHNRYVPEFGPDGQVASVLAISRDITAFKRALDALHVKEQRLAEAQRIGAMGSWELDLVSGELTWSEEIYRIFEIDPAQFGASYEAFLAAIHPDDRDKVDAAYTGSLASRIPYSIDHRLLFADGRVKHVHERCETDYDADGRALSSRGTVQDMTDRVRLEKLLARHEQEFRALAENSPDTIGRYDRDCRRIYANPALVAGLGCPLDELLSRTPTETFPGSESSRLYEEAIRAALATGADGEFTLSWRDALRGDVWSHIRLVAERRRDGEVASVLAIGRDVTALKKIERELAASRDRLRELAVRVESARESERKHMAREIHDDLGQVLSALRMNVSMLRVKYGDAQPELVAPVQNIMVLVDRTIQTVRDVTSRLRPAALDMGVVPALEWLLNECRSHIGLDCELWADEGEVALDEEHATAMFRIVQEALTNVVRHADAQRVEVALVRSGDDMVLTVRDDGKGFDPARRRANAYGLVGMQERAEMMGGRLTLESAPGQGSTIELRMPVEEGA